MKTAAEKKKKKKRSFSIATIVEMFLTLLMIPIGLATVQGFDVAENIEEIMAFLVLVECILLALTAVLRAKARRYRNQIPQRRRLDFIFSALFLGCAVALLFQPTLPVMTVAGVVFMVSLVPNRVLSILRNRNWMNIVWNVAFIVLVVIAVWDVWTGAEAQLIFVIAVMLFIAMLSLVHIMSVTFARLRLDLLRDIVQKTYAAEIIFGLLLLIASFSFVLRYTDSAAFE